ncbi:flagellar hook-length control protein FliK [Photobacterium sp. CCB-ST2H9]|uniref:flagellar hook-length control protein FliK n=1 Tax=Photobacterium sp. CCB-ST2H9 TaxID=2912855 RepID=UPI002006476E|nr:flagellar hook-length control protein FliK [Photobacterium sp. CCB-ST2H9]UTM58619.1 flagellar hook-length control protein FliK [Photobacterium sp. CCB-ST2H9]
MNTIVSNSKLANSNSETGDIGSGIVKPSQDDKASSFTDSLQSKTPRGNAGTERARSADEPNDIAATSAQTEQDDNTLTPAVAADIIANLLAQAEKQLGTGAALPGTSTAEQMAIGAAGKAGMQANAASVRDAQLMQSGAAAANGERQTTAATSADNARLSVLMQQTQSGVQQETTLSGLGENRLANSASSLQTLINGLSAENTGPAHAQSASAPASASATSQVEWASVKLPQGQQSKWGEQMMQVLQDRVQLQASQNLQEARIRLDPPDLGKLDLIVRMDGDRLSVQIHANQAAVRDALVQVSERLRAELQDQNFVHVDVNVGDGRQGQQQEHSEEDSQPVIFANQHTDDHQNTTTDSGHWLSTRA